MIIQEQTIDACPKNLKNLQERSPKNLDELASLAEQYLKAHSKQLYQNKSCQKPEDEVPSDIDGKYCTYCKRRGH